MPTETTSKPTPESNAERRSLTGLLVLIVLTNGWFISQVVTYF